MRTGLILRTMNVISIARISPGIKNMCFIILFKFALINDVIYFNSFLEKTTHPITRLKIAIARQPIT